MSRISRDILRRDKAYELLDSFNEHHEQKRSLNTMGMLTAILKDINPDKMATIKNGRKLTPIWETICVAAKIASLDNIWSVPEQPIEDYIPDGNNQTLKNMIAKWKKMKTDKSADALDMLQLLNLSNV